MKLKENLEAGLLQGDLEDFEKEYYRFKKGNKEGLMTDRGAVVKAAVRIGWLVDVPKDFDPRNEKPQMISKWAVEIDRIYTEASTPDPN